MTTPDATNEQTIPLLDHGYVRFIEHWGSDERIVEAARMSTNKGFLGWEKDTRFLRFLYTNKHATPFEMAGAIFEIKAPILVFREWHRHRTQCVAGSQRLVFERPCDGTAYVKTIADVVKSFHDRAQRPRLQSMRLRGTQGTVSIQDAWCSGCKDIYCVKTDKGSVLVSADHVFKTPNGHARIADGLPYVMGMIQVGARAPSSWPVFTEHELTQEEWKTFAYGYDVSSLGRVRSWRTTRRTLRTSSTLKKQTVTAAGRAVVNVNGHALQVSHLVANMFLGRVDEWVLHIDDNPLDNRRVNLKLGDAQMNHADAYVNGGRKRLREAPVKVQSITRQGESQTFDLTVSGNHWFVADNLIIHNSYNEMSARYIPLPDEDYLPTVKRLVTGSQAAVRTTNKQAQGTGVVLDAIGAAHVRAELEMNYARTQALYEYLLSIGVPKELARCPLPVARYSKMRASANLRNWIAFLTLRQAPNAQEEIRVYADAVYTILKERFPRTLDLYTEQITPKKIPGLWQRIKYAFNPTTPL